MIVKSEKLARRWSRSTLLPSVIIVIAVVTVVSVALQYYYYNGAEQLCRSELAFINETLEKYSKDSTVDYSKEVRLLISNYENRDKMELMALDIDGNIISTSSGFEVNEKISVPDFFVAVSKDDGIGTYRGKINGESLIAVTQKAPEVIGDRIYALRIAASLDKMNKTLWTATAAIVIVALAILVLQILSGIAMIHSIVNPIDEISQTAKKIAGGNFDDRVSKENDDEIGQLCDAINDMAQELGQSEKMKNDFISSVSHELRTPLTAIKGWSETIASEGTDVETTKKGMDIIQSETDRLSQMVEELLDFSRIQSGRMKLVFEKMDIFAELEEAVLMYSERAKRENINLVYDETEDIVVVNGDHNRIRQVFINIIDNALKYSDAGGTVKVSTKLKDGYISIMVADTGIGIKAEDLPNIKKKFYKANLTRRGNGIGLAVADEIISSHKGELIVDSVEGKGTTVTIKLPTAEKYEELNEEN